MAADERGGRQRFRNLFGPPVVRPPGHDVGPQPAPPSVDRHAVRNVIRHVQTHNRVVEVNRMWRVQSRVNADGQVEGKAGADTTGAQHPAPTCTRVPPNLEQARAIEAARREQARRELGECDWTVPASEPSVALRQVGSASPPNHASESALDASTRAPGHALDPSAATALEDEALRRRKRTRRGSSEDDEGSSPPRSKARHKKGRRKERRKERRRHAEAR